MMNVLKRFFAAGIFFILVSTIFLQIAVSVKAEYPLESVILTSIIPSQEQNGSPGCPLGTDYFYVDFNPTSDDHTVDGGRFETETWITNSQVTQDDFDDTPQMAWTNSPGVYSAVRNDEDLPDDTSPDGAWCSCAKETGGASEKWDEFKCSV